MYDENKNMMDGNNNENTGHENTGYENTAYENTGHENTGYRYTSNDIHQDDISGNTASSFTGSAGPSYGSYGTDSSYGSQGSSYGSQGSSYGSQSSSYGSQSSSYSNQGSSYGSQGSSYGNQESSYGGGTGYTGGYTSSSNTSYSSGYSSQDRKGTYYGASSQAAKKEKKQGSGKGKFFGKIVAAAATFGVVASLVFTGSNMLIASQSSGSRDEGSSTVEGSSSSSIAQAETSDATDTGLVKSSSSSSVVLDVSDVVEKSMPSIVSVTSMYQAESSYFFGEEMGEATSCGSGFIVARTNDMLYIVTNNHVIEDAVSVTVTFNNDTEVPVEVKGTDSSNDLAVLCVSLDDIDSDTLSAIEVADLGESDNLKVGEAAIAIGNALGYGQSVTTGVISALNREVTIDNVTNELLQTDAAINPGNSGGALLNQKGEVIGINSAKYSDTDVEGMGYAIPISTAIPIINELIEREEVSTEDAAYLGVQGMDVSSEVAQMYNLPEGLYVSQVVTGSAADNAGIIEGDIIVSFDGKTIDSMEALVDTMKYYASGTKVEIVVARADNGQYKEVTLDVTLGSKANQ